MPPFPSGHYRDPLDILIEREEKNCAGCKHERSVVIRGRKAFYCCIHKQHGKRCEKYQAAEGS